MFQSKKRLLGISNAIFLKKNILETTPLDTFTLHCANCTQYFISKYALTSHKNTKHSAKPQIHVCTSSGKTFSKTAYSNIQQSRIHEQGPLAHSYQWYIEACNRTLQQKENLPDQMNTHPGSKPYS